MNWNKEFKENWHKGINGNYQTIHFAAKVLSNLDMRHFEKIERAKSFLDYGCALGQTSIIFGALFMNLDITCYDISEFALNEISKKSPIIGVTNQKPDCKNYDIVYCSNVIEHFDEVNLDEFEANEMTIFLVPYDQIIDGWPGEPEQNSMGDHKISFSVKNFKRKLGKLERTLYKPIKSTVLNMGTDDQLLVVYEKFDDLTEKDIDFEKKQVIERYDYLMDRIK